MLNNERVIRGQKHDYIGELLRHKKKTNREKISLTGISRECRSWKEVGVQLAG